MLAPCYLVLVAGLFGLVHHVMRNFSEREPSGYDLLLYGWSLVYLAYVTVAWAMISSFLGPLDGDLTPLHWITGSLIVHGVPGVASATIAYLAWRDGLPAIALIIALLVICVLPLLTNDLIHFAIAAPVLWNVTYAAACIPIAISQRTRDERATRGQCLGCGYQLTQLPAGLPCPECGSPPEPERHA